MGRSRWSIAGALLGLLGAGSIAAAADLDGGVGDEVDVWSRPHLFGDWGGLRSRLQRAGIEPYAWASDQALGNVTGGQRRAFDQAGQLSFGAAIDGGKALDWRDAVFKIRFVDRWGYTQSDTAGIPALMQTNEVAGRGQILRLTELSYQQGLFDNALTVKVGRLPANSDFYHAYCDFVNGTFCGGQPGFMAGNYIYNWPISQWAAVIKAHLTPDLWLGVGVFDQNEQYLRYDAGIAVLPSVPEGSKGVLVPVELGWQPKLGGLPGDYRIGYLRSTWDTSDVVTGAPADHRSGAYVALRQQVTGVAGVSGLTLFANATRLDRTAHVLDLGAYGGFEYFGLPFRRKDGIGFAFGTTRVNPRVGDQQQALNAIGLGPGYVQRSEYAFEAWYAWQATGWLQMKFDAQYIKDPGGYSSDTNRDAVVLGLKSDVTF